MNCATAPSGHTYDISDPVQLIAQLSLASTGESYDPTVVRCKVLTPYGALSSYVYGTDVELVRDSSGHYSLIFFPTTSGFHTYRWETEDASGEARSGAEERNFYVRSSAVVSGESAAGNGSSGGFDGGSP